FVMVGALAVRFLSSSFVSRIAPAWRPAVTMLALTCLWALAEFLPARAEIFGVWALPLGIIGYSQIDLPTARLASLSSVTAVSVFVLLINASLAASWIVLADSSTRRAAPQPRTPWPRREVLATVSPAAICLLMLLTASLAASAEPDPDAAGLAPAK